jgi:hypothetical protein
VNLKFVLQSEGEIKSALSLSDRWGKEDSKEGESFSGVWKCVEGDTETRIRVDICAENKFFVTAYSADTGEVFKVSKVKSTSRTVSFEVFASYCGERSKHRLTFKKNGEANHTLTIFGTWKKRE